MVWVFSHFSVSQQYVRAHSGTSDLSPVLDILKVGLTLPVVVPKQGGDMDLSPFFASTLNMYEKRTLNVGQE